MAVDISTEITAIEAASTGEDVRESIVDALEALATDTTLPDVTSSDAGSFLVVNDEGEWDVAESDDIMLVPTDTLNISSNGIYNVMNKASVVVSVPSSITAQDEGKVVSNGVLVAQTARASEITLNGTYDTTTNNSVTVNISGGGGIPLITHSAWNALTTAQKQAYGLVAIQNASTGFNRGILVSGADYDELLEYLPYSDINAFTCIAKYDNFDPTSLTWGMGTNPLQMSALCEQYVSENAVYFDALTSQKQFDIPLESITSDFTIYVVLKGISYASGDVIVVGSVNSWSSSNGIFIYHRSGTQWNSSIYGSDALLIDTSGDYVVVAMRSKLSNNIPYASWFASNGAERISAEYNTHGTKFEFGYRTVGNAYSADLAVKFIAFAPMAELDDVIKNNISNLKTVFGIS